MPRLSRAESQARTRQKILTTAKTCFMRDGFTATSLEGIAEAAGFSKGAVYSNFVSKDALCLAVLDAIRAERAASLAHAITGPGALEDRIASLEAWAERNIGDRAWTALEVEFGVHAARDVTLSRELSRRHTRIREVVVEFVRAQAAEQGLALPMPIEDVAVALLSLSVGLGVQRAIDPSLSVRTLGTLVRLLVAGSAPAPARASKAKRPASRRTAATRA